MAQGARENEIEKTNWHWRNTMRTVRFFTLDARAAIPFGILLVYARPITLLLALIVTLAFNFLEKKGLTFPAAIRSLRVWLIGQARPAWISMRHRTLKDFG